MVSFNKTQYFVAVEQNVQMNVAKKITIKIVFGQFGGLFIIFHVVVSAKPNKTEQIKML